ncbi:hypothetical protein [Caproiciproducens sp. MSJ-32]|uniref:hypothetical protein n=1 Tax=Caproiciproducens sp. MSJ-32 TaxID=2841527 RepID=UPI001C1231B5|nr:hypothetical protein [Caproiciproducens sp. MSJ-32]MBU5454335.1 hypothetical protein [Caproiciproducens sp. MSJ-32]
MKIEKALKKEQKNIKRFYILMIFLFISLPLLLLISQVKSLFITIYLYILEILIVISCISKANYHYLKFSVKNNKLKFKSGLFGKEAILLCDKVVLVHTNKAEEDLNIVLVSTSKFRNNYLKPITKTFMKKYPEASNLYIKIKRNRPEEIYYFQVIKKGALKKYILLDEVFKNCVKAQYTASAIENIKIARGQIEL